MLAQVCASGPIRGEWVFVKRQVPQQSVFRQQGRSTGQREKTNALFDSRACTHIKAVTQVKTMKMKMSVKCAPFSSLRICERKLFSDYKEPQSWVALLEGNVANIFSPLRSHNVSTPTTPQDPCALEQLKGTIPEPQVNNGIEDSQMRASTNPVHTGFVLALIPKLIERSFNIKINAWQRRHLRIVMLTQWLPNI